MRICGRVFMRVSLQTQMKFLPSAARSDSTTITAAGNSSQHERRWADSRMLTTSDLLFVVSYRALRLWRGGNLDYYQCQSSLNSVQHLQPSPRVWRTDSSLCKKEKQGTADAQSLNSAHHCPPSGSPQTARHLASPGIEDPSKDDSSELSSQVSRLQRKLSTSMPELLSPQHPGKGSRHCAHLRHQMKTVSSMRSAHMVHDAAKGQHEPNASDSDTLPRHITHRSSLMTGPASIFDLYVFSVRLLEQSSGSSGGLPKGPTSLGILFESSAHCPDGRNLLLCVLLRSKTKAPWPS